MQRVVQIGRRLTAAVLTATAMGCAGTQLATESVSRSQVKEARTAMRTESLRPSMRVQGQEQVTMVRRVEAQVRPAARTVCKAALDAKTCKTQYEKVRVVVKPYDATINATAAIDGEVTMYGGLLRLVGSDDEVAGVLSHEIAHVLLMHNEKGQANQAIGALVGLAAGVAVVAASGPCYSKRCGDATADLLETGLSAGAAIGSTAYSPEMELEADQLATYIVREAGYDVTEAGKLFIRMTREETKAAARGEKGLVGFLRTHPTDARRIAHWRQTAARIEGGERAPMTKEAAAREARITSAIARCERLYERFPECPDWGKRALGG